MTEGADTDALSWLKSKFAFTFRDAGQPIAPSNQRRKLLEKRDSTTVDSFDSVLDGELNVLGQEMLAMLKSPPSTPISFGIVEDKSLSARTYKRQGGGVAITISKAFTLLLSRLIKLRIAVGSPQAVSYYNRGPHEHLGPADYARIARQVLINYRSDREVRGPYIELDERGQLLQALGLMTAESFLLGHEIAHLVSGKEDLVTLYGRFIPHLSAGAEQSSHDAADEEQEPQGWEAIPLERRIELGADRLGAHLSVQVLRRRFPEELVPLVAPSGLFRLFELLTVAGRGEARYPDPLKRCLLALPPYCGEALSVAMVKAEYSEGLWWDKQTATPN